MNSVCPLASDETKMCPFIEYVYILLANENDKLIVDMETWMHNSLVPNYALLQDLCSLFIHWVVQCTSPWDPYTDHSPSYPVQRSLSVLYTHVLQTSPPSLLWLALISSGAPHRGLKHRITNSWRSMICCFMVWWLKVLSVVGTDKVYIPTSSLSFFRGKYYNFLDSPTARCTERATLLRVRDQIRRLCSSFTPSISHRAAFTSWKSMFLGEAKSGGKTEHLVNYLHIKNLSCKQKVRNSAYLLIVPRWVSSRPKSKR